MHILLGFLPTFGPAFIYIQPGPFYLGSLLVSVSSSIGNEIFEGHKGLEVIHPIDPVCIVLMIKKTSNVLATDT